ncbi:DUF4258 domain-containing protein, partial [Clostridium sp.]|uniref:DUF4258 domain-containing protein n=1 Tax=Clostridium sp. TaxID=1506 RepID=UPI00262C2CB9
WKRIEAGSNDESNKESANKNLRLYKKKIRVLLDENSELRRNYNREKPKTPYEKPKGYEINNIKTKDGVEMQSLSTHLKERAKERNISEENITDALISPLKIGNIKIDNKGRKSKVYIGEKATVAINTDTGVVVTTYPTSTNKANKLKELKKDEGKTE